MVGAFQVNRVLPRRVRCTVGSWCYRRPHEPGHGDSPERPGHRPHPHIGLQTITWLLQGEVLHRDSLGSEQVIRPGQLNLMTVGRGVSHSEETREDYEGDLHGVQLWLAQPTESRDGPAAFEHHAELPGFELENGNATVLVGELPGCASPARRDTDHVGVHLDLWSRASTVPLVAAHEYALAVLEGVISVGGQELVPGQLGYLGTGRDELLMATQARARVLLIGGEPFPEALLIWWNYVARTREEITDAHRSWVSDDDRFGTVASPLERILTADPPWAR